MAQQPKFTDSDAAAIIAMASNAPLQNMKHAALANDLLVRFKAWYAIASKAVVFAENKDATQA